MVIKFGCMPSGSLVVVINQNGSIKGHLFSATFGTFFWHFSCSINKVLPGILSLWGWEEKVSHVPNHTV